MTQPGESESSPSLENDKDTSKVDNEQDDGNGKCSCDSTGTPGDGESFPVEIKSCTGSEKSVCKKSYSQLKKRNSKKKRDKHAYDQEKTVNAEVGAEELPAPKSSWLLRLFESKLFDMAIAIAYLFKSKESGVLAYLGNKLFSFPEEDVNFYLPELINMYIHMQDVAVVIAPYLLTRCKSGTHFALHTTWLLDSHLTDGWLPTKEYNRGKKMLDQVTADRKKHNKTKSQCFINQSSPVKKAHQRSKSEVTFGNVQHAQSYNEHHSQSTDNIDSSNMKHGLAFGKCPMHTPVINCAASTTALSRLGDRQNCICKVPLFTAEREFVDVLMTIGERMRTLPTKELKTQRLYAELSLLNLNLPARVFLPFTDVPPHYILKIPQNAAVVLNSKDRAPYIIYVEILEIKEGDNEEIASDLAVENPIRQVRSEEQLPTYIREREIMEFSVRLLLTLFILSKTHL
eukprot:gene15827-17423_t